MSLEQKIDDLVKVIERLVTAMESRPAPVAAPAPAPVVTVTPVPVQPKVVAETLVGSMVSTPSMPPLPTFTPAPAPALTGATVPFNDPKGLIDYVMTAYKSMGAQKGAGIQHVLTNLGFANINDVTPPYYQALYDGVEALK